MKTVLDIECSVTRAFDKTDPSPFNTNNNLVSVGYKTETEEDYLFFYHNEVTTGIKENKEKLQKILDKTTLLVGHNIKFDLMWLLECGFKYDGAIHDTMIFEYVKAKGLKLDLSLAGCCERYNLSAKKDILKTYLSQGVNVNEIPLIHLEEYGRGDIQSTYELFELQEELMQEDGEVISMMPAINLMQEFCIILVQMERDGIYIDLGNLSSVEKEYRQELDLLQGRMTTLLLDVMGHTTVNLSSPEQLSQAVYSRRVLDKTQWAKLFNLGTEERNSVKKKKYAYKMTNSEFTTIVRENTEKLRKTESYQCECCKGFGKIRKIKKDGNEFKKETSCRDCGGKGFHLRELQQYAGFRVTPLGSEFAASGGFSVGKKVIEELLKRPNLNAKAREFLTCLARANAVSTYLSSFVEGIQKAVKYNVLHTSFNQCITATGRLSSSNPNFQNLPRGKTFPVRKVIKSRWKGGKILDCDFAQLEFRAAALLSQDQQAIQDIINNVDIHIFTRDTLCAAGQIVDRQQAKAHTFKPLYGGLSGTEAEMTYYKAFLEKYKGIAEWQKRLAEDALHFKQTQSPSGRIYAYPYAQRMKGGRVSSFTQIVNYPVQGFATGDLMPVAILEIYRLMKLHNVQSKLILTVHDSVTADVHPEEINIMIQIFKEAFNNVPKLLEERFKMTVNVPIGYDLSIGDNWMEKEKVA